MHPVGGSGFPSPAAGRLTQTGFGIHSGAATTIIPRGPSWQGAHSRSLKGEKTDNGWRETISKSSYRKGRVWLVECSCVGRPGSAIPLQCFLSKTRSLDVSAPPVDWVFYLFGKLKDCSGFASFWCPGNLHCWDINPCLVRTRNLQFKQIGSKERNEMLIAIQIAPSSVHPLPTLLPAP